MTSHRKTDYRLRRLDANRLELPNDRGIPVRIFANDGVPIERAAVDELLGLLELQETIARMLLAAPELFDGEADTLNAYIWQRRLERIRQDLADPALADHSITEIAFGRGFSSSTHFSRSFRESCGVSPRVYRLLMQGTGLFWNRAARRQWTTQARLLGAAE